MNALNTLTTPIIAFALREWDIFLGFTWRDWSSTLIPGFAFALGATKRAELPIIHAIKFIPWVTLYIYFFDLSNQITGIEEDRVNKPDRPLPSGKVELRGAKLRWAVTLSAFLAVAMMKTRLLPESVAWIAVTAFLSLTPGGGHWLGKNGIALSVGTWSLLSGIYKTIAVPGEKEIQFIVTIAIWGSIVCQIADLRDIAGDTAIGRKTLTIAFGETQGRWIIAGLLIPVSCFVLWMGNVLSKAPVLLLVAHAVIAYRVVRSAGPRHDHKTFMVSYVLCNPHAAILVRVMSGASESLNEIKLTLGQRVRFM